MATLCKRLLLAGLYGANGLGHDLSEENPILIRTFLLEKAIYKLGYELGAADWVLRYH